MKIAYVTATFPYGPGETFLDAEVKAVARLVDGIVVVPTRPVGRIRERWSEKGPGIAVLRQPMLSGGVLLGFLFHVVLHPLSFLRIFWLLVRGSGSARKLFKNLLVFPKGIWLAKRAKEDGVDHIHVHWGSTSSTMVLICGEISHIPWSLTCHRWDIYENNLLASKSDRGRFVRFISRRGASDAEKLGVRKAKSVVIPMGVKVDALPPVRTLEREVPQVLCAANLIEVKGHKYLIEAIRILRDRHIQVRLLLAGAGALENELRELTRDCRLEDRIEFLGQLDHANLMHLYDANQIDLFVLSSIETPGGNHEGVPVSLMEAMAHGVPCISTKTGSIEELIPPAENLTVPHTDAEALAKKIGELVTDPAKYTNASRSLGKILFAHWTAAGSAQRIVEEIESRGRSGRESTR